MTEKLTPEQLIFIKELPTLVDKTFCFGGSIALNVLNVIDRPIKDIDVVVSTTNVDYFRDKFKGFLKENENDKYTKEEDDNLNRYIIPNSDVHVCLFHEDILLYSKHIIDNIIFNVIDPYTTMVAKAMYIKTYNENRDKHLKDIESYRLWIMNRYLKAAPSSFDDEIKDKINDYSAGKVNKDPRTGKFIWTPSWKASKTKFVNELSVKKKATRCIHDIKNSNTIENKLDDRVPKTKITNQEKPKYDFPKFKADAY